MSEISNESINNMYPYSDNNISLLRVIGLMDKENQSLKQNIDKLRTEDKQKLHKAFVDLLTITKEIKNDNVLYDNLWEYQNAHQIDDFIDSFIEILDRRYKRLD